MRFIGGRWISWWQFLFVFLGTSWLWAPQLNYQLSSRVSLISQYEASFQPYAWLFRLADFLAAALLLLIVVAYRRRTTNNVVLGLLLLIGLATMLDPMVATSCRLTGNSCQEFLSANFLVHALASVVAGASLFAIAVYDTWLRKKVISLFFVAFQLLYGILFMTQLASQNRFNTLSQYIYQTVVVVWVAWFVRDFFEPNSVTQAGGERRFIRQGFAAWALLNGFLAILVSLADIDSGISIKGVYFAGNSAWLAQHGVVVGVLMLYLSRHLARGERRARQLFLVILGIEVLKYSLISPGPLLIIYLLTFGLLFIMPEEFNRGPRGLTWHLRLKEALFMLATLATAAVLFFGVAFSSNQRAGAIRSSINHFFDYTVGSRLTSRSHLQSALLAHTYTAFLLAGGWLVLWILFKPAPLKKLSSDPQKVKELLVKYSRSSEDFFKIWPPDKNYYFLPDGQGFIAYKIAGPVMFGLADPVAANRTGQKQLIDGFLRLSRERGFRACFLPVEEDSLKLYHGLNDLQIGSTALVKIDEFLNSTIKDKWWRWKINRATKSGYTHFVSQPPYPPRLMAAFKKVSDAWLTRGGRRERGFALGYFDQDYLQKCPVHYLADASGQVAAFTNELPQFKPGKLATLDLLRHTPDAGDAMPFLIAKTIEHLSQSGAYQYFDLGFVPFTAAKDPIVKITSALSRGRFSSKGLEQFKNKFNPEWQPIYMAYDGDLADLALIAVNIEKVMSPK